MTDRVEIIATAVRGRPHSFAYIRRATGLGLTDDEFRSVVAANRGRFRLVRFLKRDAEGELIRPGRPGVQLRAEPA